MRDEHGTKPREVHPGVQTGGRQAGQGRPRNVGGGRHPGHTQASLTNWVRAERKGQLGLTADGKPAPAVTAEQAEIARLRAEVALFLAKGKKKFVVTTDSAHQLPVAPDLVQRRFEPAAPNGLWSGDITYLPTDEGWLYPAAVLDLHSRQVVGWSLQPHMQTSLIKDALLMACFRRKPAPGLIFHSDRGSPILQPGVPGHPQRMGHSQLDVAQGELLGQCSNGKPLGATGQGQSC